MERNGMVLEFADGLKEDTMEEREGSHSITRGMEPHHSIDEPVQNLEEMKRVAQHFRDSRVQLPGVGQPGAPETVHWRRRLEREREEQYGFQQDEFVRTDPIFQKAKRDGFKGAPHIQGPSDSMNGRFMETQLEVIAKERELLMAQKRLRNLEEKLHIEAQEMHLSETPPAESLYVNGRVGKHRLSVLVDSGARRSGITRMAAERFGLKIQKDKSRGSLYGPGPDSVGGGIIGVVWGCDINPITNPNPSRVP